ncbi:IS5 family transposase [Catenulispora rubra]|uniref:IS5 family transposase n=1 Tax=Catenulispora rubra TaxID=280293 RepID=UPI003F699774
MPSGIRSRFDLTDAEWERLAELIPVPELGRRSWHLRAQFNGIMWRFRCGTPWRDVPERYGNWNTIYDRFRTWRDDGTWDRLLEAVLADAQARGQVDLRIVSVDSTTNRAHQHAAGAVFEQATLEAFEESLAEAGGKKGAEDGDEPPLSRTELANGLREAIRLLTDPPPRRHQPLIRTKRRVVRRVGGARPALPPPTSDAPGAD